MSRAPSRPSRWILPALVGALVVAAGPRAASAQEASPVATYRTALMEALRAHTGAMRAVVTAGAPFRADLRAHATAVHQLALQLSHAFPEGSGGDATRSKDEVWTDGEAFHAQIAAFQEAAAALEAATTSGDDAAVGEALTPVTRSCSGCHRDYRKPAG